MDGVSSLNEAPRVVVGLKSVTEFEMRPCRTPEVRLVICWFHSSRFGKTFPSRKAPVCDNRCEETWRRIYVFICSFAALPFAIDACAQ
jgi:hypothetical protein